MSIRPYTDEDLDQLLEIWYRASLRAHPFLTAEFLQQERTEIAEHWIPIAETKVYEAEGRLVGFLSLVGEEVGGVFVDPAYQGRGIGTALMGDARNSRPRLELSVFAANAGARLFYESLGFEIASEGIDEATGQPEIRMSLDKPR